MSTSVPVPPAATGRLEGQLRLHVLAEAERDECAGLDEEARLAVAAERDEDAEPGLRPCEEAYRGHDRDRVARPAVQHEGPGAPK
jgi:hypothetical protein